MFASGEAACPHHPQLTSACIPEGFGWMRVGTPALAAGEATVLGASSGVGAQGSVLRALSSAPSRMRDTETKPLLGTTADSKRPIFKH